MEGVYGMVWQPHLTDCPTQMSHQCTFTATHCNWQTCPV